MRNDVLGLAGSMLFFLPQVHGCSSPSDNHILVNVSNIPQRAMAISVSATLDGKPAMNNLPFALPLDSFGILVPAGAAGHLVLSIKALDSDQCTQGTTEVDADLPVDFLTTNATLSITSPRQCGALPPCAAGTICPYTPPPTTGNLWGLWENSPTDVWAVGDNSLALHFDGTSWSNTQAPAGISYLNAVWASGPSDVWAVGASGNIIHYDGQKWSQSSNGAVYDLNGVFGLSAHAIWAVGSTGAVPAPGEFWTYDGVSWTKVNTGINGGLNSVWASSGTNIYACGDGGLMIHFTGSAWETLAVNPATVNLRTVWGPNYSAVFAAGSMGSIYRLGGGTSTLQGYTATLYALTGDGTTVYAVGDSGGTGNLVTGIPPYSSFMAKNTGTTANLRAVTLGSDGIAWVAGTSGFLGYFDTRP